MNSLYGEQILRVFEERYSCKSEHWMMTEYDEEVLNYQKTNYGNYIIKTEIDEGLQDEVKEVNTMRLPLGAFVLSNSKRIMKNFYTLLMDFRVMLRNIPTRIVFT